MPEEDTSWSWSELDRTTRAVLSIVGGIAAVGLLGMAFFIFPAWLTGLDTGQDADPADINARRQFVLQFFGGIAVLAGFYWTARRIRASERRADALFKQAETSQIQAQTAQTQVDALRDELSLKERGQVTERFSRAVEQLGSESLQIRLGAIYAFERIARESRESHWPVMNILSAFIRSRSESEIKPIQEKSGSRIANMFSSSKKDETRTTAIDIETALTVIGRRNTDYDAYTNRGPGNPKRNRLNLRGTYALGANLAGLDFSNANLEECDFSLTNLEKTIFHNALLTNSNLSHAKLMNAELVNADLYDANFSDSDLCGANVCDAKFHGAIFSRANLVRVKGLTATKICFSKSAYKSVISNSLEAAVRKKCPELLEPPAD